ncbi:MAG: NUDIX hydrolase [Parvularculaceae bacterium]
MTEPKVPGRIGPWRVKATRQMFENPWISVVDHDVIHPNGSLGQYGVVRFKHRAIGVLPFDDRGNVWIVGQHRFPLDAYSWELPEGGGKLDEDPLSAAKRELAEETGLVAKSWSPLAAFDISNSVTDETAICYLAWDLAKGPSAPEPSEELDLRCITFADLLNDVLSGAIRDSLTIVMALSAHARALRGELPEPIFRAIASGGR